MNFDFSRVILGPKKEPYRFKSPKGEIEDLTLAEVAYQALNAPAEKPRENTEALRLGLLSLKVADGGIVDLTTKEAATIQEMLRLVWSNAITAIAHEMLEIREAEKGKVE